ncbi:IPP transferase [Novipirellula aureliae]|uniref:tRNA dimethylallyltransferase n=1 Tax=Novipirellula aureliae TaxID=2527966 RepID=A0A5C6EAL9_9BACT|nr:tRNA (adenosine(37)-N6)-dimethylallyltransferase MiaA [Novipirellula aureliae]TWU45565.1 IPP transferase [Novipirellula aureliae]
MQHPSNQTYTSLAGRIMVVTGPTASGKSSIAMCLAEQINGEILSLDSIAVYRGMDIGTAKATIEDQQRVPHHLIDLVSPSKTFSVACYLKQAHAVVEQLEARGKIPIFVGGTPMFLKAILRGFDPGPPADEAFRRLVEQDVDRYGTEALHKRLQQVDPLAAHRIDPADARRMIRALEVAHQTGQPLSHRQVQFDEPIDAARGRVFWIAWDRKQLHQRINERVERMFQDGLVDEVKALLQLEPPLSKTAAQAVGYRELIACLETGGEINEAKEQIAIHTRQLAKRQESWLRSFSEIDRIEVNESISSNEIANIIHTRFLSS